MAAVVQVDTSGLQAGLRQLVDGIGRDSLGAARKAAETVAANIRQRLPVDTGTLVRSVIVVSDGASFGVSYGADVRYARPVAATTKAVAAGIVGVPDQFARDCQNVAATQVARL